MFCEYKDIFGKPNEGAHSYKINNIAVVDVLMTIIVGWLFAHYYNYNKLKTILFLLLVSIPVHMLFCVKTTITKLFY